MPPILTIPRSRCLSFQAHTMAITSEFVFITLGIRREREHTSTIATSSGARVRVRLDLDADTPAATLTACLVVVLEIRVDADMTTTVTRAQVRVHLHTDADMPFSRYQSLVSSSLSRSKHTRARRSSRLISASVLTMVQVQTSHLTHDVDLARPFVWYAVVHVAIRTRPSVEMCSEVSQNVAVHTNDVIRQEIYPACKTTTCSCC